jgi:CRISPR type I-E-associated protein CasB/Cse2
MSDTPTIETPARLKDPIASLAGQLRHADTGTLARLRRHHPAVSRGAAFDCERLLQAAGINSGQDTRSRWALVLHCLALAEGGHDPRPDHAAGAVLARLRFSEARVRQLVEADEAVLADLLPRVARRLGNTGASANWWPLARLVLNDPDSPEGRDARAEIVRSFVGIADYQD